MGYGDSKTWNRRHEDNRQGLEEQFSKRRSVSKATNSVYRFCPRSDAIFGWMYLANFSKEFIRKAYFVRIGRFIFAYRDLFPYHEKVASQSFVYLGAVDRPLLQHRLEEGDHKAHSHTLMALIASFWTSRYSRTSELIFPTEPLVRSFNSGKDVFCVSYPETTFCTKDLFTCVWFAMSVFETCLDGGDLRDIPAWFVVDGDHDHRFHHFD